MYRMTQTGPNTTAITPPPRKCWADTERMALTKRLIAAGFTVTTRSPSRIDATGTNNTPYIEEALA